MLTAFFQIGSNHFFHEERQCKGKAHENEERYEERYRDPFIHNVSNHIRETGKNL